MGMVESFWEVMMPKREFPERNVFLKSGGGRLEETRRTARVLDVIQHIAVAPSRWTRKALAEKYEVSERQIQKDFEIIRNRLNLDLRRDGEGYFLWNVPKFPTLAYSFPEAMSLLLAARAARMIPGIDSDELAAAIGRLESLFPPEVRHLLKEVTCQSAGGVRRQNGGNDRHDILVLLNKAICEKRGIVIIGRKSASGKSVVRNEVDPYRINPFMRVWRLIAYDHARKDIVEIDIDRIKGVELLERTFELPEDLSMNAYFVGVWGVFPRKTGSLEDIVLEFEPDAARWVKEGLWPAGRKMERLGGGRMRMKISLSISPDFLSWLMYFGRRVRVIKPDWLREKVAAEHLECGKSGGID